jgi:inner membrane protein
MKSTKENIYVKLGAIAVIVILLLIPTSFVHNIIDERESTQLKAIQEVSNTWGKEQNLLGPFISIPYLKYATVLSENNSVEKIGTRIEYIHIMPSQLKIDGQIYPEKRNRGIYDIVVYNSKLKISGKIDSLELKSIPIPINDIQFDKAEFVLGLNDLNGIQNQVSLSWNNQQSYFKPGVSSKDIVKSGINSKLDITSLQNSSGEFSFELDLNGSKHIYFTPVGNNTDVHINSTWQNPSFKGAFLPDNSLITENGFEANWNILDLNRNFPQIWTNLGQSIQSLAFGVELLLPVDNYQKADRSIKYAILFIVLTFTVFFFIEVLKKVFIHPIQYILVGIALVLFFTLLISISEQLSFNTSFILSAIATLSLITAYVKSILKSTHLAIIIAGVLGIQYTFIFVIIQLQNYSLIIGSLGLFLILGLVMYFSRKIDWYDLQVYPKLIEIESMTNNI